MVTRWASRAGQHTHRDTDKEINEQTDIEGSKTVLIKLGPPFNFVCMCGFVDLPRRIAVSLQLILNQYQHHKNVAVIYFPCSDTEAASITACV